MPSEKVLASKKEMVAALVEKLKKSSSIVVIDYEGIPVDVDTKLRAEYRAAGVEYVVAKNSLLSFAMKEVGMDALQDCLKGATSIAIGGDDVVAPAKIYAKYAKDKDYLNAKAGFMDGEVLSAAQVDDLAKIPSKEGLVSQLLYVLNSPIAALARAVDAIAEKQSA